MSENRERGRADSPAEELFSVPEYLREVRRSAILSKFEVTSLVEANGFDLPVLSRGLGSDRVLYLSSGVHGDEPAGPLAIQQALHNNLFSESFGWVIFPVLNPTGLVLGRRENAEGIDPNRDYLTRRSKIVRAHCEFLESLKCKFAAALGLHEDWEAVGGYLYEHNPRALANPCEALLAAIDATVGLDPNEEIDDWPIISTGLIHPPSDPSLRETWPEQIFLLKRFTSMSYTVETPSAFSLEKRVRCHVEAIRAFGDLSSWMPVAGEI